MEEVSTIDLDIAEVVFQAHGADAAGRQLYAEAICEADGGPTCALSR